MVTQTLCWVEIKLHLPVSKSSSKFGCPLRHLGAQEKEIEALKSCVSELKSSASKRESKLDPVVNSLSMTVSPSGMDSQQIPGIAAPASYAQITRNSTSLRKHEPRDQIR